MKKWSGFLGKPHLGHSDFWTLPLTNRGPCKKAFLGAFLGYFGKNDFLN